MLKLILELLKMVLSRAPLTNGEKDGLSSVKNVEKDRENLVQIKYKNDSKRLKYEHEALKKENLKLFDLIQDLAQYLHDNFNRTLTITMINRTQDEQDKIYSGVVRPDGRRYDERPWTSPHQYAHAVDIRSKELTPDQIRQVEDYLNAKYNPENYYRWTARNHDVGLGDHFHVQFFKDV